MFALRTYSLANGILSVTSVPDPATWALMLIGLGGIGVAERSAEGLSQCSLTSATPCPRER